MTNDQSTTPAPGWYPAPHANNELRYWDGSQWLEAPPTPAATGQSQPTKKRIKWWGWALIVLAGIIILSGLISAINGGGRTSTSDDAAAPVASQEPAQPAQDEEEEPASEPVEEPDETVAPPPPPAPDVQRQVYEGSGDNVVPVSITAPAIVTFDCPLCARNTVLKSNGAESLLVNTIGAYRGARIINVSDNSMTTQFTVEATGAWSIVVEDITTAPVFDGDAWGAGDSVIMMDSDFSAAEITNEGDRNFVVRAFGNSGNWSPLIVNEIGAYHGIVEMSGPAFVEVTSTGNWSIAPR